MRRHLCVRALRSNTRTCVSLRPTKTVCASLCSNMKIKPIFIIIINLLDYYYYYNYYNYYIFIIIAYKLLLDYLFFTNKILKTLY